MKEIVLNRKKNGLPVMCRLILLWLAALAGCKILVLQPLLIMQNGICAKLHKYASENIFGQGNTSN